MTFAEYDTARKDSVEQVYSRLLEELGRFGFRCSQADFSTVETDKRIYEVLARIYEPMRLFNEYAVKSSRDG